MLAEQVWAQGERYLATNVGSKLVGLRSLPAVAIDDSL
jgi:hypothetical protein